jgi:hypothetical protein
MQQHFIFSLAAVALSASLPAYAADAACQAIIDAGRAKLAAPMLHDINVLGADTTAEFIKIGNDAWLKADRGWKKMPPAMLKNMQKASLDGLTMKECKQAGSEMLGLRPTRIYSWTTIVGGKSYGSARVWIGSDGLPYKQSAGSTSGTTSYTGVVAPKAGR